MDIASREALEDALEEFPGTVLAVTHDRYFMNRLARKIWELDQGKITVYLGDFDDYKEKSAQLKGNRMSESAAVGVRKSAGAGAGDTANANANAMASANAKASANANAKPSAMTSANAQANAKANAKASAKASAMARDSARTTAKNTTNAAPRGKSRSSSVFTREKLEKQISDGEAQLNNLDQRLENLAADELSQLWTEREKVQEMLDRLYEQWMQNKEQV